FSVAGPVEHRLDVVPHRAEFLGPDVESVVYRCRLPGQAQNDDIAEIGNVEELVEIVAGSQHRKVSSAERPAIQQLKNAKPLRPDETLRAQDGNAESSTPGLETQMLGADLRRSIRSHAPQRICFVNRVMIRNAVDRRR